MNWEWTDDSTGVAPSQRGGSGSTAKTFLKIVGQNLHFGSS